VPVRYPIEISHIHYNKLFNPWRTLYDVLRKHHEEHCVCDVFVFFVTNTDLWHILVFRHICALMDIQTQNTATYSGKNMEASRIEPETNRWGDREVTTILRNNCCSICSIYFIWISPIDTVVYHRSATSARRHKSLPRARRATSQGHVIN
jgi:hypothetical protein